MVDFVVAGAGPVGSYLAMRLAEKYDVILLEEHENIGLPVACSGMVSNQIWDHIPMNESLIQNKITGVRAHSKRTYSVRKSKIESFVLNRQRLDEYIAGLAKKSGVNIMVKNRLNSFVVKESSVECNTSSGPLECKMLAGCDGPLSIVRKGSGVGNPNFVHGIFGYTNEEDFDDMVDVWYDVPGFFSWKIPRGKAGTEWGLAVDPKLNANKHYEEFKKKHRIEPVGIHSALIPYGKIKLYGNRTFLCGDAGSQVKSYSGGGIVYGIIGARIASETINPDDTATLKKYQQKWLKEMGKELWLGRRMMWMYSHRNLLNASLWALEKMNHDKLHMDKPSTILSPRV